MTVRKSLNEAVARLAPISDTPHLDAELLMAHALGVERDTLLLVRLDDPAPALFDALLARRLSCEPVAYITGRRAFWTIELEVGPGVLIPRPDSETLIEAALHHFGTACPARILDLGTGPGTLLLAALAEWPESIGHGRDSSEQALAYARRNAERLGLEGRASFSRGDWAEGLTGPFDLILCNPPYVETEADLSAQVARYEPAGALYAGPEGLDDYRRLAPFLPRLLALDGIACIEIGHTQAEPARALFAAQGLTVALRHDLAGRPRCLILAH